MCNVIPVLAPGVSTLYVSADNVLSKNTSTVWLSLGNAVWSEMRDHMMLKLGDDCASQIADLDSRFESRQALSLEHDVVPLLEQARFRLVLVADELDSHFFSTRDPEVRWDQDLEFLTTSKQDRLVAILAGTSPNIPDLLDGWRYLKERPPLPADRSSANSMHHALQSTD